MIFTFLNKVYYRYEHFLVVRCEGGKLRRKIKICIKTEENIIGASDFDFCIRYQHVQKLECLGKRVR